MEVRKYSKKIWLTSIIFQVLIGFISSKMDHIGKLQKEYLLISFIFQVLTSMSTGNIVEQ